MFLFSGGEDPSLGDVYANMDPVQYTGPSDWVTSSLSLIIIPILTLIPNAFLILTLILYGFLILTLILNGFLILILFYILTQLITTLS